MTGNCEVAAMIALHITALQHSRSGTKQMKHHTTLHTVQLSHTCVHIAVCITVQQRGNTQNTGTKALLQ
jgi:hypothetical protein